LVAVVGDVLRFAVVLVISIPGREIDERVLRAGAIAPGLVPAVFARRTRFAAADALFDDPQRSL
jgi:hypothetical protein